MKKSKKTTMRILAVAVIVAMLLSVMPMTAFAATGPSVIVGGVEMYSASGATYYVNGGAEAVTEAPANWNAKYESNTLTINNLSVMGTSENDGAGIYAKGIDLTIDVQGANSVTGGDNLSGSSYGVYVQGINMLTLSGTGALSVTGGTATEDSYGICADAVLIQSGTINATGGTAGNAEGNVSCGIGGDYGVLIENGTINATGGAAYESVGIEKCYEISGGTVVATGGNAVYCSYGITRGTSNTVFSGGVVVMHGGTFTSTEQYAEATAYGYYNIHLENTKIAGQVVNGIFTGNLEEDEYDGTATDVAIVPDHYTVQNTEQVIGTNENNYTVNADTAIVTPGSADNGVPLYLLSEGGAVTLNKDLVLINLQGAFYTPAFSINGTDVTVSGSGTLTAIGAANKNYSYGISISNKELSVDGARVIAIGGTASSKSYGIGTLVKGNAKNGGSVVAIGGAFANESYGIGSYTVSVSDTSGITAVGGAAGSSGESYGVYSNTSVTVAGGTLNAIGGVAGGSSYGIYHNGSSYPVTVDSAATATAMGATYGLAAKKGSLAGGSYIGGTGAVYNLKDGSKVTALLSAGYGYFAGDAQLTPGDSDLAVGLAYQTVTAKELPHIHNYTYSANQNVIIETCTCGHSETAALNAPSGDVVYDGTEKIATVSYSENWKGGDLTVTHNNNINAGALTASASISIKDANAEVYWTILAATPLYDIPTDLTATYGETLADVTLPAASNGTWTWVSEITGVGNVGAKTFKAIFTPNDDNNFITVVVDVPVTVNRATPQYTVPTGITATYGDMLADVALPDGWSWKDPLLTSVGDAGPNTFNAIFTHTDAGNYNTVEVAVTVTVEKASPTFVAPLAKEDLVYDGEVHDLVSAGAVAGGQMQYAIGTDAAAAPATGWSTTVPAGRNAGTYYVWYKVAGDANFTDIAPACITVNVAQRQIGVLWGATEFIPYNGSVQIPEAVAAALMNEDVCLLTVVVVETTEGAGIIPGRWTARVTALSNPNYCLPEDSRLAEITYGIVKGSQNYPPEVTGQAETAAGKGDGKIVGLTTAMEYATTDTMEDSAYTRVTDPDMVFAPGTYYVRYAAYSYYKASYRAEVIVDRGEQLTVTFMVDGQLHAAVSVDYGEDVDMAQIAPIPYKEGYDVNEPYWDGDGKNITADTVVNAVYTPNLPASGPDTGDSTPVILLVALLLISTCSLLGTAVVFKKQ